MQAREMHQAGITDWRPVLSQVLQASQASKMDQAIVRDPAIAKADLLDTPQPGDVSKGGIIDVCEPRKAGRS